MPCVSAMAGDPLITLELVFVGTLSLLLILWVALMVHWFPIRHHNDLCNLTATLLREICTNVTIEPHLQSLTGEHLDYWTANREDNAKLDEAAHGFWGISGQSAFFDVRVFNPMAPSLSNLTLHACYSRNEQKKKRLYDQRVWDVEFGSFSPLIFSTAGGLGPVATIVYKRIAFLISTKLDKPYCVVINFIRCQLSFSLLRSTISCLRGTRTKLFSTNYTSDIDLALAQGQIDDY